MRAGVWLWLSFGLLSTLACSGGYPLEPTPCDDWCDATQGATTFGCSDYAPAACVSQCEQMQLDVAECSSQFDAALTCYRTTPGAVRKQCDFYSYDDYLARPCYAESEALLFCSGTYLQQGYRDE